jgi:DinB superfamily
MSPPDAAGIAAEYTRVRDEFRAYVDTATPESLARRTAGTRWTNRQMLFHQLFGYLLVRVLIGLAKLAGRLPRGATRPVAAVMNALSRPFHVMNYVSSAVPGSFVGLQWMVRVLDRVTTRMAARRARETPESLARGMCYPAGWDPFFQPYMTVADLYHYPTQHFDWHARQLTL